jgi:hypothetical protein
MHVQAMLPGQPDENHMKGIYSQAEVGSSVAA